MAEYYEGPWYVGRERDKKGDLHWTVTKDNYRRTKRIGRCAGGSVKIDYFARAQAEADKRNAEWRKANGADAEHEYTFSLTLVACLTVRANTITEAKRLVEQSLSDAVTCTVEVGGKPHPFEASLEGEAELLEIDGEFSA